jgi:multiple sugar transport system substrate-binding protein
MSEAFEAEHPNIHINYTYYPSENYNVKVNTAIAAGEGPDLILAFDLNLLIEGQLLPLDDMVAEHGIDLSTYNQGIIQGPGEFSCSWEGRLYCLASNQDGWAVFYNKGLFDAAGVEYPAAWPPMTVEEFADVACRLTDQEAGVWGAAVPLFLPYELYVSPDGRTAEGYMNSPDVVHQFDVLSGIVRDGCSPSTSAVDPWDESVDYFATGVLGMAVGDVGSSPKVFENAGIDYGVTAPPTPAGVEPFFDVYGDNTAVLRTSDHPEEAMEFIAWLATEGQRIAYETEGSIPIDNVIAEEVNWAEGIPGRIDVLEVLSHARPPIFIPNKWDVLAPLFDAWGYATGGERTTQQALDDAAAATQENLDKAWEIWDEQNA